MKNKVKRFDCEIKVIEQTIQEWLNTFEKNIFISNIVETKSSYEYGYVALLIFYKEK